MDAHESKQYWEECMNEPMVPKGPGCGSKQLLVCLSNNGTDAVWVYL